MLFLQKIIHTSKRQLNVALFLFVLLSSTAVATLSPIVATADPGDGVPPASAKVKSPETQATSFWYYNAVAECVKTANFSFDYEDQVKSGEWVAGGSSGSVAGYYMRETLPGFDNDGRVNCNENGADGKAVIQSALKFWGLNPLTVACETGLVKRLNGTDCIKGDKAFTNGPNRAQAINDNQSVLLAYIRKNALNGASPGSLSKEASYIYNLNTFLKGCANGKTALTSKPSGERVYQLTDKTGKTVWYIGEKNGNWGAEFRPNPNIKKNCQDLVNDVNTYSKNYLAWVEANPDVVDGSDGAQGRADCAGPDCESPPSCAIDAVGWIVCPVVNFMAGIVDSSYSIVAALLTTPPLNTNTGDARNGAYIAWKIMRNFANVMFVIAFIIIIYSQLTGAGINNYGIKKLLPKLVIAAILVNVSYWVCAIAVDLSNILGSSIKGLMDGVSAQMPLQNIANETDVRTGGAVWGPLAVIALAAGTAALLQFTILLPLLIAALAAIVTVFIVLVLRQALIIALIVVSPLAFVALLLPNTEGLFKKWRVLLVTMLLMFPIIAFIFGASSLASTIIQSTTYSGEAGKAYSGNILLQIVGAGIAIIPLFITPLVMKTAGGLLNRFAGVVNDPNKGIFDRMRKGAAGYRGYRKDVNKSNRLARGGKTLEGEGGGMGGQYSRRRRAWAAVRSGGATVGVNNAQKASSAKAMTSENAQEYFAKRAVNQEGFAKAIAGSDGAEGLSASAQGAVDKIDSESVKNREILLRAKFDPRDLMGGAQNALKAAIEAKDVTSARAAQNILLNSGGAGLKALKQTLVESEQSSDGISDDVGKSLRKDINGAGLKGKDNALATWSYQQGKLDDFNKSASTYADLSDKELVGQSPENIELAVKSGAISVKRAQDLLASDSMGADFTDKKRGHIQSIIDQANAATTAVQGASAQQVNPAATTIQGAPAQQAEPETLVIPRNDSQPTGRRSSGAAPDTLSSSSRSQSSPSRAAPSISDFERLEQAELNRRRQP